MQTGHIKVVDYQRRVMEEESVAAGVDELERPPVWLADAAAKKEWKRLVPQLIRLGIAGNLDRNNLGGYCNAYSAYMKATKELKKAHLLVERVTKYGTQLVENPLINIQKKYSEEMRRYAALCGLTIDARLKAGAAKIDQQEETLERKFGSI